MKENEQGRVAGIGREKIKGFVIAVAPTQVPLVRKLLSSFPAALCVRFEEWCDRRHTNARRIFVLQLGKRPGTPQVGFCVWIGHEIEVRQSTFSIKPYRQSARRAYSRIIRNYRAGCCCVRQCSVPKPQTRSTA